MTRKELGALGEHIAANYLQKRGISILKRNYFSKFGEIDLIGIENRTIIFVEVKLRTNAWGGGLFEAINYRQFNHLIQTAMLYLERCSIVYDD